MSDNMELLIGLLLWVFIAASVVVGGRLVWVKKIKEQDND